MEPVRSVAFRRFSHSFVASEPPEGGTTNTGKTVELKDIADAGDAIGPVASPRKQNKAPSGLTGYASLDFSEVWPGMGTGYSPSGPG